MMRLAEAAFRGVDHDELFHDRVVDRSTLGRGVGLHDEHVGAAD